MLIQHDHELEQYLGLDASGDEQYSRDKYWMADERTVYPKSVFKDLYIYIFEVYLIKQSVSLLYQLYLYFIVPACS